MVGHDRHLITGTRGRFRDDISTVEKRFSKVERRYRLETSAIRNDLSLTFQCELWRVIGVLANGLMEDPQMKGNPITENSQPLRFFSAHGDE